MMVMDKYFLVSLLLLYIVVKVAAADDDDDSSSAYRYPYLTSQSLFISNYQKMISDLKIYAYPQPPQVEQGRRHHHPSSLFHSSLLKSPFLTTDGNRAHLFYLPISTINSSRTTARLIRDLRSNYPYWNRTLGADHFYVSSASGEGGEVRYQSNRNMVELKKNSVRITPANDNNDYEGKSLFVPHKDIILPSAAAAAAATPLGLVPTAAAADAKFLILVKGASDEKRAAGLLSELRADPDFHLLHQENTIGRLPRFRLFVTYGYGGDETGDHPLSEIGEALQSGWVPLILSLSDRPVLDLPFADLLKWSEIAVFVGGGGGGGSKEMMKKRLFSLSSGSGYERMRELGKMSARHFVWNHPSPPLPSSAYDAFHTLLYQLWMRRHVVRYTRHN
ncbi:hypothetical protein Scep_015867 [Stephania cephalantha]|uniref:Exostosin GT47 domain-containing protein n=1 Tax=Stephania cephalantha TaxID=152367 RepID=A0AAP0J6D8_9MAGN